MFFVEVHWTVIPNVQYNTIQYNTIQYKFYCQRPMGAFQRQVLIVQVIKKKNNNNKIKRKENKYHKLIINKLSRNYLHMNL